MEDGNVFRPNKTEENKYTLHKHDQKNKFVQAIKSSRASRKAVENHIFGKGKRKEISKFLKTF